MADPKAHRISIEPLRWEPNDPSAAEHQLVSEFVSQTLQSDWVYYKELDLSTTEAGKKILEADTTASAQIVLALGAYVAHRDDQMRKVKALAKLVQRLGKLIPKQLRPPGPRPSTGGWNLLRSVSRNIAKAGYRFLYGIISRGIATFGPWGFAIFLALLVVATVIALDLLLRNRRSVLTATAHV